MTNESIIATLKHSLMEADSDIIVLQDMLKEKDEEIARLNFEIRELKMMEEEAQNYAKKTKEQIQILIPKTLSEACEEIFNLKELIDELKEAQTSDVL